MNSYSKLIQYLILCLFCLSMLSPIKAYSQQNAESNDPKYCYAQGKEALEGLTGSGGAKGQLDFAKKRLNEILTLEDIQSLGHGEMSLSDFFMKLAASHGQLGDIINTISGAYFQAAEGLKEAMEDFKKAVELAPDYTDAYLKLMDVYLIMNIEKEAVEAYESCRKLGFNGMTLSLKDLRDIARRIAKVYSDVSAERASSESKEEPGVEIIRDYMSFAEGYLKENPNEAKALGFDSSEAALIVNRFELVQFYIDTYRPTEARREYDNVYSKVEADLSKELNARKQVWNLNSQIEQMEKDAASFTFSFATKERAHPELMEAWLNLLPTPKMVVGEELTKYYVVSILPTEMSIKLADEIVINNERKTVSRTIPAGNYTSIVTLLQPNIKTKAQFPFRIVLNSVAGDIDLTQKSKVTLKDDKVIIQSPIQLQSGQEYNLRIEPPPPPPSLWRKITLFALFACAAGVSAIAY